MGKSTIPDLFGSGGANLSPSGSAGKPTLRDILRENQGGIAFDFANLAALNAQAVTATDIGKIGRQVDIGVAYMLMIVSPNRWDQVSFPSITQAQRDALPSGIQAGTKIWNSSGATPTPEYADGAGGWLDALGAST